MVGSVRGHLRRHLRLGGLMFTPEDAARAWRLGAEAQMNFDFAVHCYSEGYIKTAPVWGEGVYANPYEDNKED